MANASALVHCLGLRDVPAAHVHGRLGDGTYAGTGDGASDDIYSLGPGTFFVYGGATAWLTTRVRVKPGETLRLRIMTNLDTKRLMA